MQYLLSFIGLCYSLLIVGWVWTWSLFPQRDNITDFERILLGFGLSIITLPAGLMFVHKTLDILPVTTTTIIIVGIIENILALLLYVFRKQLHTSHN